MHRGKRNRLLGWAAAVLACLTFSVRAVGAPPVIRFDLTRADQVREWHPAHDIARLGPSAEGMAIAISGSDPYVIGPPRDLPAAQPLWLRLRVRSDQAGLGQIFFFRDAPTEEDSVRFPVRAGVWEEVRLPIPSLGPGYRLRFDPPGAGGVAVLSFVELTARTALREPAWPRPAAPDLDDAALTLRSGDLTLAHAPRQWGGFTLRVAGELMGVGHTRPLIGYQQGDQVRWLPFAERATVTASREKDALLLRAVVRDEDGAQWEIRQRFRPAVAANALDVETRVTVSQDRRLVYLPLLMVLPGVGSFGQEKHQGLFAGLEYLENEPSSSEADVVGPASRRQVPDTLKITLPLMAIQARDRYVGLIWEKAAAISALFDSPDRVFGSGGHVMGLFFPGSQGASDRTEGSLLPYEGTLLAANRPLLLRATLIGGRGRSIVPAVQQYVALRGLPPVPPVSPADSLSLLAHGWLDSSIREADRYRHAFWPGFNPQPAADAAFLMEWLAPRVKGRDLAHRLTEAAKRAIAQVPPGERYGSGVSHVRYPGLAALVYGQVAESAEQARAAGRGLLARFEPDGTVRYRKSPDRPDYGKTHNAPDASGLTASVVASLLEAAAFCGDPELIREGLRVLRALDKFAHGVPRGAQTWEVPLHTPDILAAAYLVRAYTLGYELTGDTHFLEQARHWAWTGVPFVYLVNPTGQPVGSYATIAVLGATNWTAPVWLGQPVQWCGLVYADAVARMARHDPAGPWERLADGITASGLQQTWPRRDPARQGLLPDFYLLRTQASDGPAINPGTVQTNAVRLLDGPALYDFHRFPRSGILVHAPGNLLALREEPDRMVFTVRGWPQDRPYHLLLAGVKAPPRVRIDGRDAPLSEPHQYLENNGWLVLRVQGAPTIEIATSR